MQLGFSIEFCIYDDGMQTILCSCFCCGLMCIVVHGCTVSQSFLLSVSGIYSLKKITHRILQFSTSSSGKKESEFMRTGSLSVCLLLLVLYSVLSFHQCMCLSFPVKTVCVQAIDTYT